MICGVFTAIGMVSATTWTIAGDFLNRFMSSGRSATLLNVVMGVLLFATALVILMAESPT